MSELKTAPFSEQVLRDCLRAFPEVVFAVTGECMRPDLAAGERVHLVAPARHEPRLGDVVLTRNGGALRLHRLVWRPPLSRSWRTQADRASLPDPALFAADILGTVVAVEGRAYRRRPLRALASLTRAVLTRVRAACAPR
jgi:hypothetical protein